MHRRIDMRNRDPVKGENEVMAYLRLELIPVTEIQSQMRKMVILLRILD